MGPENYNNPRDDLIGKNRPLIMKSDKKSFVHLDDTEARLF